MNRMSFKFVAVALLTIVLLLTIDSVTYAEWTPGTIIVTHSGGDPDYPYCISQIDGDGNLLMRFGGSTGSQSYVRAHLALSGDFLFRSNPSNYTASTQLDQFSDNGALIRQIDSPNWSIWEIAPDFENISIYIVDPWWATNVIGHLDNPVTPVYSWFTTIWGVTIRDMYMCPGGPLFALSSFGTGQTVSVVKIDSSGNQELFQCQIPSDPVEMPQGYFNGRGGIAVSPTNGYFYISAAKNFVSNVFQYDTSGTLLNSFPIPMSSAPIDVDYSGNIYVRGPGNILVFSPTGTQLNTISVPDATQIVDFLIVPGPTNSEPIADAGAEQIVEQTSVEGAEVTLDGSASHDPDDDDLTYSWTWNGGQAIGVSPTIFLSPGQTTVTLVVNDGTVDSQPDTVDITVKDTIPPEISIIEPMQYGLYPTGSVMLNFGATDSGSGVCDCWGILTDSYGYSGNVDSGFIPEVGVYDLVVAAFDCAGNYNESDSVFFIVYDSDGGFVTGGGWIWSELGSYKPDTTLEGKANFGFVSKYKKGATVPTGNTEFVFQAGDLNFHSSSYEWLVVTGSNYARFKGSGTINGLGDYKFMLWAGDDESDTFRIRIWTEDETTGEETDVYDNGTDQPIEGGSIIVHEN